ncbi:LysR family transcriptional regulator [Enterobacter hormaechei]|uniref:LysR family transcriptional regulator n=1 Tax=Enterobacter hormaechei TaxID=158836 RepID=UPI0005F93500|nr:LysR family transcriptional regulator [Enterobacter hormaechei]KJW93596.1 LysR family transcriptional regulator [Enterobacter hormaechei subsp. steigerwaltii]
MTDTLKDIPVFVASVEAGSFAQAAVRLHLSRSAVGKSIARLEERLGVRLFHRTTRSQRLTDNGALFYERCLRALVARKLGEHRMVLCAAPDYLFKNGQPQTVDDLRQHTAINYTRAGRVLPWQLMDYDGTSRTFIPRSSLNMDDLQAICDAALAGHGLAWLPCWMVIKEIQQGDLVPLLKQAPDVRFDVHAVWQQTPHLPLRVRIAIDMLVKRLPAVMSLEFPASIKKPR